MKHKLLITLFAMLFAFSFTSKAQFDSEKYDKLAFLIGTLSDYMGYQRTFNANSVTSLYQRVDIYRKKGSLNFALFIDSLFSSEYSDMFMTSDNPSEIVNLYSPSLTKLIDKYYNYKPFKGITTQGDAIFYGLLKKGVFKTEKEKLSFLLGAYLRYEHNGTISIANSMSKAALCAKMLRKFDCEVEYTIIKGVPGVHKVLFWPSQKIQELINEAENLNNYITNINTDKIEFTPNGTKYILKEPHKPYFSNNNVPKDSVMRVNGKFVKNITTVNVSELKIKEEKLP